MTPQEIFDLLKYAEYPEEVNAAWRLLGTVDPFTRRALVNALENELMEGLTVEFKDKSPDWEQRRLSFRVMEGTEDAIDLMRAYQGFGIMVGHVVEEKGQQAAPLLIYYVQQVGKMSDAEYNTVEGQIDVMIKAFRKNEEMAKPAVAAMPPHNPRKKPPRHIQL